MRWCLMAKRTRSNRCMASSTPVFLRTVRSRCVLALVIGAAAAILGSPMGILFADESGDPTSIAIEEIVLEANTEFGETISDLVASHPECSNVEFHYEYEDGYTWASYWPEVLAIFAVNQNLNGDDDVIVINREKADLLIDTFWMMHRIESEVEEVEVPADNGDGFEESEYIESQTEYILHITVTSVPVDDLAHDLSFTDDQMDILHQLLSDEMRPMLGTAVRHRNQHRDYAARGRWGDDLAVARAYQSYNSLWGGGRFWQSRAPRH